MLVLLAYAESMRAPTFELTDRIIPIRDAPRNTLAAITTFMRVITLSS
jgi:hypothetical protein